MKCRLLSDIHLDISDYTVTKTDDEENTTLIIAGDIASVTKENKYKALFDNLSTRFKNVIFIAGNHDYWGGSLIRTPIKLASYCEDYDNIIYLQNDYVILDNVLFLGATLWTMINNEVDKYRASVGMNDYHKIRTGTLYQPYQVRLRPYHLNVAHNESLIAMRSILATHRDKVNSCVVITHHAPHVNSTDPRYNKELDFAYYTNLTNFILTEPMINVWCHGHIHQRKDYLVGNTRVLCNPRGYEFYGEKEYTGYDPDLIFEV